MSNALYVFLAFAIAGLSKGLAGMGLPLVAMALLVFRLEPVAAAGIIALPAILSNAVQASIGGHFLEILKRFWPLLLGSVATILLMSGAMARFGSQALLPLGLLLLGYSAYRLSGLNPAISPGHEKWLSPLVGVFTGAATALTNVLSVPVTPFLNALHLERRMLLQAMGISYITSTTALALSLGITSGWQMVSLTQLAMALAGTLVGILTGIRLRNLIEEKLFQKLFLVTLAVLGIVLMAKSFA